jgi:hypothetical protein
MTEAVYQQMIASREINARLQSFMKNIKIDFMTDQPYFGRGEIHSQNWNGGFSSW